MVAQIDTEATFSSRTPQRLFEIGSYLLGSGRQYDISPDGDRFIFRSPSTTDLASDAVTFNGLIFVENWFQELTERVPVN